MPDEQTPSPSQNPDADTQMIEIDWRSLARKLLARKKLIAQITAACTLYAVIAALMSPSIYRAEVLIMPLNQEQAGGGGLSSQFGDLAALAGISFSGSGEAQTQRALATLKSRALTESFMKEAGVLQALYPSLWDEEKKNWKTSSWFGYGEKPMRPSMEGAYHAFDQSIRTVRFDKKTNLTTVAIEWTDPVLAAHWANQLVRHTNAKLQSEAVKDAEKNIGYLNKQLAANGSVEVQKAIYSLIEAQMKNIMVASTREEYAFKVIDPANPPERKIKPNRRLMVLFGLVLGFMAGVAAVLALPYVQPWFQRHVQPHAERYLQPYVQRYVQPVIEKWRKRKPG